jgi:filamentous hemagglutinin
VIKNGAQKLANKAADVDQGGSTGPQVAQGDGVEVGINLSQSQIDSILQAPKGQRPDPSTYMSKADIDAHLAKFDDGAVRFASANDVAKYGTAGPPNGGFVIPKSEFDGLIKQSGGDLRVVEKKLGLDSGSLSNGNTVALEINPKDMRNLRVPSGNEGGTNNQWIPGGYTSGGVPEAVMDFTGVPFTPMRF